MFESELEKKIAEVRLLHSLKNLKLSDVLDDGDEILDSSFSPYSTCLTGHPSQGNLDFEAQLLDC
jgi:hypothetical protein